jgi:hypothetical protein
LNRPKRFQCRAHSSTPAVLNVEEWANYFASLKCDVVLASAMPPQYRCSWLRPISSTRGRKDSDRSSRVVRGRDQPASPPLTVVRTSVDHGTASDIAGTGVADERRALEAMRQSAEMAQ